MRSLFSGRTLHRLSDSLSSAVCYSTDAGSDPRTVSLAATRAVLRLAGADVISFLQGILTNDVSSLQTQGSKPVYAALLNAQGRFLHDLFLHSAQSDAESRTVLADVDKSSAQSLLTLLKRYKLRAKVDIADVSSELCPWVSYGNSESHTQTGEWPVDPRLHLLGRRTIAEHSPHRQSAADLDHYQLFRFQHGVAEGSELPHGHAVPLEYNLDGLNAISYSKGCYIGQELIARAHYQGVVRKRLMPASVDEDPLVVPGADLTADLGTRSVGRVIAVNGHTSLVLVRLKAALQSAGGRSSLFVAGTTCAVRPSTPSWWPDQWQAEAADLSSARL